MTIGLSIILLSLHQLIDGFRRGIPVKNGSYAYTRNPIYFSAIIFIIPALILIMGPILLIPVPFLTYSLFKLLTGKKERIFEEKFVDEYIEYWKNVNSLIPRFNRRSYNNSIFL
ncbi:MAG: hypothetical protein C0180_01590 [Aciduliprofundum sp.]|nr:MAG: hypothetical protein C0180_01590 [Aciduliprofundum sp.]